MGTRIKIAVAQVAPIFLNRDATVKKVCDWIARAGSEGARWVVFPETVIPGYPYWLMTLPSMATGAINRELFENSVIVPGAETEGLAAAARDARCGVVIGVSERAGGTMYNSQLFFSPEGVLIGRRRKLMPTFHERMVWGRGDGTDLYAFDTSAGRVGGLICYEHSNALFCYAMQSQREEIHFALWPGGMHWISNVVEAAARNYAFQAQAFVASASSIMTPDILAWLSEHGGAGKFSIGGGHSCIVAPFGELLAGPAPEGEVLLTAELDFDRITDRKIITDCAGHYARPDVVRLLIERGRQSPVVECPDASSERCADVRITDASRQ
jgi:nitrilase